MDSVQGMTQTSAMRQEQTLTPQQLQSLDILCAPVLELQQKINQELALLADEVVEVVYGIPVYHKKKKGGASGEESVE